MKKQLTIMLIVVAALSALLLTEAALAAGPTPATSLTAGASSHRDLSSLPAQSVTAQAGNITPLNISALSITKSWQGYYGNVSGAIVLADANNKTFYNWSVATLVGGRIYATRNSSTVFTTVNCTNSTGITTEIAALGQTATDADSVSNTFTLNSHPAFSVGSTSIAANACKSTNAFGPTGSQGTQFYQVLLSDANGAGNIIYTTLVNGTQTGFDNNGWAFELLVGQNGHSGGPATTPYYFYVELN